MRPGSLLIFDLDGTLFHTETVTVPATRAAFERHGLAPPSHEAVCAFIGRPGVELGAWLTTLCPPTVAERIVRDAAERELELIGESGVLYPGVPEMLADLRPRASAMAICSNGSRRYVEAVLGACEIGGFFDQVRYRTPTDRDKPQMLADLLRELGRPAGSGGIVIGDRKDDVEAAHANGLRAVGCLYGYGRDGELDAANGLAQSATELAGAVTRLLGGPPSERIDSPASHSWPPPSPQPHRS